MTAKDAETGSGAEKDLAWSNLRQGYICLHCGQLVMLIAGVVYHESGDCEAEQELEGAESCAGEGYAVFGADQ